MRFYTFTDMQRELQVTNRQLHAIIDAIGDIQKQKHPRDARYILISAEDYARIEAQRNADRQMLQGANTDSLENLRAELDNARAEIRRLRSERMQNTSSSVEATPAPREARRSGFTAHREEVPAGYVRTGKFAEDHGVPEATARGHIRTGKFAETTQPIGERRPGELYHFLDHEQQEAAIRYWRQNYAPFSMCENGACVCHGG